jgi:hypothetical protein
MLRLLRMSTATRLKQAQRWKTCSFESLSDKTQGKAVIKVRQESLLGCRARCVQKYESHRQRQILRALRAEDMGRLLCVLQAAENDTLHCNNEARARDQVLRKLKVCK